MKVRRCKDCNEYKYIEENGFCRDCYNGFRRSSEYNISYDTRDVFDSRIGMNQLVVGDINSGKTVGNKLEMIELQEDNDTRIYVVDLLGEYSDLVSEINAKEHKISKDDAFNIMKSKSSALSTAGSGKVLRVYDFLRNSYDKLDLKLGPKENQLLRIIIEKTYKRFNSKSSTNSKGISSPNESDLLKTIQNIYDNPSSITRRNSTKRQTNRLQQALMSMYKKISKIINSLSLTSHLNLSFNGNVDYFNLEESASDYPELTMNMVFNEIWEQAIHSSKKTIIYLDDADALLETNELGSIARCFRHARHNKVGISITTPPNEKIRKSSKIQNIIASCNLVRIHRMTDTNCLEDKIPLSDNKTSYINNAKVSNGDSEVVIGKYGNGYSEELIRIKDSLIKDIH
jgi:Cdc6-like AAA superfamily ATPase